MLLIVSKDNMQSLNSTVSLSEIEKCLIIAGLYVLKNKQTDDTYKAFVQKLIDKVG